MPRRQEAGSRRLVVLVGAAGLAGIVTLLCIKPPTFRSAPEEKLSNASPGVVTKSAQPALPAGPQRLPVVGALGTFVVIHPDGTSYLETPQGRRNLVSAEEAKTPSPAALADRISARLQQRKEDVPPKEPSQLIVLDEGIVDVPQSALVTLMAKDRLVVLNADGTSTVYHASGKIETRQSRRAAAERSQP